MKAKIDAELKSYELFYRNHITHFYVVRPFYLYSILIQVKLIHSEIEKESTN